MGRKAWIILVLVFKEDEENKKNFVQKLTETGLKWLTDSEVRVRVAAGECLGELCSHFGPKVYLDCKDPVLLLVKNNLERKLDLENKGGAEEIQETGKLMEKLTRNQNWEAANIFHDTAGWKNLETSLSCLQRMMEGLGILATQFIDEDLLKLIFICLNHTNRFVDTILVLSHNYGQKICHCQNADLLK